MKKSIKSILTLLLAASFMAMSVTPVMAANRKTIDYVAFGDSIAAGVRGGNADPGDPSYESKSKYGYTNIIANYLNHADMLSNFSKDKNLCRSGMTAAELAKNCNLLLNNKYTHEYNLVKNADIITIDIGANDLLGPLYDYVDTHNFPYDENEAKNALVTTVQNVYTSGGFVGGNIATILQSILKINPNVKIYVMGYYNPLPGLSTLLPSELFMQYNVNNLSELIDLYINNNIIKAAIDNVTFINPSASITYIDTMNKMAENPDNYLVPTDIHPTEAGNQAIADVFWYYIEKEMGKTE
ncbi:MAG: GDSL-type esterase/lipase family protein [Bacillota bacterium]|nr:GDSL-type esterase/lipase family protein [Bacillota bacterium]